MILILTWRKDVNPVMHGLPVSIVPTVPYF